jgi:hypothetical protein
VDEVVKYEPQVFQRINGSYFGDMLENLDQSWMQHGKDFSNVSLCFICVLEEVSLPHPDSNIRISDSEIARFPGRAEDRSVHLADGGYFSILNVYHNLHCVVSESKPISIQANS